jgi:hypothetical protein
MEDSAMVTGPSHPSPRERLACILTSVYTSVLKGISINHILDDILLLVSPRVFSICRYFGVLPVVSVCWLQIVRCSSS